MMAWLVLLGLLWDFDRTAMPTEFLVILESVEPMQGAQQLLVAGVDPGVCANAPEGDADDFCTTILCPGKGRFRITVEATAYKTRTNVVEIRVKDQACTEVEGVQSGPGSLAGIPPAQRCRPPKRVVIPPLEVEVPRMETYTVAIPKPRSVAPVIPYNPQVVPKKPLKIGEVPLPQVPQARQTPQVASATPPPLTVEVPTGTPTTVVVEQPQPPERGVPCP